MAVAALLTPFAARIARQIGAIDKPTARGLATKETPRLGGLAILAGVLVAGVLWMPDVPGTPTPWILLGAGLITLVGAIDDQRSLPPLIKLIGQIVTAVIVVSAGVKLDEIQLPFFGLLTFPTAGPLHAGPILTVIFLVGLMNVVNFSDGVDGLAAGLCD